MHELSRQAHSVHESGSAQKVVIKGKLLGPLTIVNNLFWFLLKVRLHGLPGDIVDQQG
jgi:hypothetical protein